jgi:hypothetical protein
LFAFSLPRGSGGVARGDSNLAQSRAGPGSVVAGTPQHPPTARPIFGEKKRKLQVLRAGPCASCERAPVDARKLYRFCGTSEPKWPPHASPPRAARPAAAERCRTAPGARCGTTPGPPRPRRAAREQDARRGRVHASARRRTWVRSAGAGRSMPCAEKRSERAAARTVQSLHAGSLHVRARSDRLRRSVRTFVLLSYARSSHFTLSMRPGITPPMCVCKPCAASFA